MSSWAPAQATATALYVLFIGSNDFILGDADNPIVRAERVLNEIDRLTDAGVRNLLSINLPMLGETPDGKPNRDSLNARANAFNDTLKQGLDNISVDGLQLFQLDLAELFSVVLEEPHAFGFSNITSEGIGADDPAGFLFWDGNHPTTQTHELFAEAAFRLVQPDSAPEGDFNLDRMLSVDDVNLLGRQILRQTDRLSFDLNQDAQLTASDVDALLSIAMRLQGDADFDGAVEFDDFLNLSGNFGRSDAELRWSDGDFGVNGTVGFSDFLALSQNFGVSVVTVVVPEVNYSVSFLVLLLPLLVRTNEALPSLQARRASEVSICVGPLQAGTHPLALRACITPTAPGFWAYLIPLATPVAWGCKSNFDATPSPRYARGSHQPRRSSSSMKKKSPGTGIARVVNKYKASEQPPDRAYWLTRPAAERLAALEQIRQEHHKDDDAAQRQLQRVYRIVKRK